MNPTKLPLMLGSSTSSREVMLPPTSFEVTSSIGDSAETFTSSLSARPRAARRRSRLADLELHVTAQELLEALQLGTDLVSPGTMPLTMKVPSGPETVSRNMPVS
jgi:hypothetical protein